MQEDGYVVHIPESLDRVSGILWNEQPQSEANLDLDQKEMKMMRSMSKKVREFPVFRLQMNIWFIY